MLRLTLVFATLGLVCSAQTNRGSIVGTVTDPQGAAVAGATVTVTNAGTNHTVTLKTSETGAYSAAQLEPVTYRVAAQSTGFKQTVIENVKVDTATTATVDIALQVGETRESVTVSAQAPLINADTSAPGTTIDQEQIQDMPLTDRFVLSLALQAPNVSGITTTEQVGVYTGPVAPGVGLNMNGSRAGEGGFLADGVNNTAVSMSRMMVTFSPDTVQEFKVQTSNFSAEYGSTGGGVVNLTTKSGTNQFHGSAALFNRNPVYNAMPFTDSAVRVPSALRANNGTATLGGPLLLPKIYNGRNKTFFFAAFEPQWRSDGVGQTTVVPTDAQRKGDLSNLVSVNGTYVPQAAAQQFGLAYTPVVIYQQFSQNGNQLTQLPAPAAGQTYVPFPNNVIPQSMLDPTSQKILNTGMLPAQSWFLNNGVPQNSAYTRGLKSNYDSLNLRIDHRLSDRNTLYGRYTNIKNHGDRPRGWVGGETVNQIQSQYSTSSQLMLGNTLLITPTLVNDLKLSYLRGNYSILFAPPWNTQNWSTDLGLPSGIPNGVPYFNFSGQGMFQVGATGGPNNDIEENYNAVDTLTWSHGSMSFKFGADLRYSRMKVANINAGQQGSYRFTNSLTASGGSSSTGGADFATFLLGVPTSVSLNSSVFAYYYRWQASAFFIQDDWKIKPNLTVNLGLRYSIDLPRTEKFGNQAVLDLNNASSVAMPTQLLNTNGTPYTALPSSLIPATTLVAPLAFTGRGGRSSYVYPPDYLAFQPRAGFAWRPHILGLNQGSRTTVLRGGYGLSYLPATGTSYSTTQNNATPMPDFSVAAQSYAYNSGQSNPAYAMRLSANPPVLFAPTNLIQIPANGIVSNSLAYQSTVFAVAQNFKAPYSQSWSLSIQQELNPATVLEIGYQGNKGTHLFFPPTNVNLVPFATAQAVNALNINMRTTSVRDPLGRRVNPNDPNSAIINVPLATVLAPYAGFTQLFRNYNSSANSIRHAGYASLQRRLAKGLSAGVNYTFQKTLTDASDSANCAAGCGVGHRTWTQISYGATYAQERSVATFNQPHVSSANFVYDLPFGRTRGSRVYDRLAGGWKISGVGTLSSGSPFTVALQDDNLLGAVNSGSGNTVVRPNVVSGVPLRNPSWSANCEYGAACGPYINPAAFERPAYGQLGNAPSVLPWLYAPLRKYLDMSLIKNIAIGETGKKTVQLRLDAFNVLNYRGYAISANNSFNGAWLLGAPSTADLSVASYNGWATTWNAAHPGDQAPIQATGQPNNAVYQQVVNLTAQPRAANNGVLPNNFFAVPLPQNISSMSPNSFDIRTLDGLKLYQVRTAYNTSWGTLSDLQNARYLQISVRITF